MLAGAIALVSFALLAIAGRAHASETLYWDNYQASPPNIAFANIDGAGGGQLNLANVAAPGTEVEIDNPEGMAYDPANGRIYIANSAKNDIVWVAVDGSGAGILDTGGAPVASPEGIAVDPTTQTVYWANTQTNGSIAFAAAGGGFGGVVNTTGASIDDPYKIALDTVHGRIYWIGTAVLSYANLNGSGGADVALPEAEQIKDWSAIDVNPAANELYVLGQNKAGDEGILAISTVGLGTSVIGLEGPAYNDPYGLAFDPAKARFYWANYGTGTERATAFGTTSLTSGITPIAIAAAPLSGPQDPVIVKSPVSVAAPTVSASGTQLSCSQGEWEQDSPGSYVYAAPQSYAYQWARDGSDIGGATGTSLTATQSGRYSCTVTATNRSGSAARESDRYAVTIAAPKPVTPPTPAALTLKSGAKKLVKVKAGKVAVVPVDIHNAGGTAAGAVKVCAKLTKAAKKGLVAPKCAAVGSVPAGATVVARLRVKTRNTAQGTYPFKVLVTGAVAKSMTAKVHVIPAKAKKH